jgi:flagellar hook assembly protein FlgD
MREFQQPGSYSVVWEGTDEKGNQVASGLYLCRLEAGTFTQVRKMLFTR